MFKEIRTTTWALASLRNIDDTGAFLEPVNANAAL
jgi:hypothetical protein